MAAKQKERKLTVTDLVIPDVTDKDTPPLLTPPSPAQSGRRDLTKQLSQKMNCLCSPTTHVGSFRCRHHRGSNFMRGSASVGSGLSEYAVTAAAGSLLPRTELGSNNSSFGSQLSELSNETAAGDTSVVRL
ncbi:hypothetical protein Taro_045201 [Colocasia esculenta]|uniref:Uncharacterized protein n=1 Tax=Colocasia esculenta TaxID=4460 RepID=A0A843X4E6_COLES|nr:hypothetical protein [Colocasia esculenta]